MKLKTSELSGKALDWAVAKAQGWITYPTDSIEQGEWYHTNAAIAPHGYEHNRVHISDFTPSSDWCQGGTIIEREKIGLDRPSGGQTPPQWRAIVDDRSGRISWDLRSPIVAWHPNPLTAAMRCYVMMMLGESIDIPNELLG